MTNEDPFNHLLEKAKPQLTKLSFGSVVGYCSGAAAKKVGKAVAVLAGLAFIAIQSAVYSGYVAVDWNKIKDDAVAKVDTVSDNCINVPGLLLQLASLELTLFAHFICFRTEMEKSP